MLQRVIQTTHGVNGNCFSACVAMIMGIPLGEVPTFCAGGDPNWWQSFLTWLKPYGWSALLVTRKALDENKACLTSLIDSGYPVILGGTPLGSHTLHAVVQCGGKILDPHPLEQGLEEWCDVTVLIPPFSRS